MSGLKKIIKQLLYPAKPDEKEFATCFTTLTALPRYTPSKITYRNFTIHYPDALSLAYQIKEHLFEGRLNFKTTNLHPVILDCGANVGLCSLHFSKQFPESRIVAFEADSFVASFLKQNLTANSINNVELVEKAIWINNGHISFGSEKADSGSIFQKDNQVKVECLRLRDLLLKEKQIDLLKMDIEGAEYEVIEDCDGALTPVKNLYIEFHSFTDNYRTLDKVLGVLSKNGFRYSVYADKPIQPFLRKDSYMGMDYQCDIYATKV